MNIFYSNPQFRKTFLLIALLVFGLGSVFSQVSLTATGGTTSSTHTTLKAAFDAINAGTSTGVITLDINGNTTETATDSLLASGVGACSYSSITIAPSGGSWTISGAITGYLIDLKGADNVTINGGGNLTFSNTATGASSTFRFVGDASNNTITGCNIYGSTTTSFGVVYFANGVTTGNIGNTISTCNIGPAGSNLPLNGVYSLGVSSTIPNTCAFTGNNIYDFFNAGSATNGLNINSGNEAWTITNNKFYQSTTRTYTTANTHVSINVISGSGHTISNNTIGYATSSSTGTYTMAGTVATRFVGIQLSAGTISPSNIQGNTISNFNLATSSGATTTTGIFCGINVTSGNVNIGTTLPNTIGSTTGTGSIVGTPSSTGGAIVGIHSSSVNTIVIQNNTIGGFTSAGATAAVTGYVHGISISTAAASMTISGNIIGNSVADNMRAGVLGTTTAASQAYGINNTSSSTILNITNNTIQNLSAYGTSTSSFVRGINNTAGTTGYQFSKNLIRDLKTSSAVVAFSSGLLSCMGIYTGGGTNGIIDSNTISNLSNLNNGTGSYTVAGISTAANTNITISRNRIYGLSNAGTGTTVTAPPIICGVFIRSGTTAVNIRNNMISLGNSITSNTAIVGILGNHGSTPDPTVNILHNNVNITGSVISGALPSFCFNRGDFTTTARTAPVNIKNNIFTNGRSGGTGAHYAISNGFNVATATATGWPANASNNNILNAAASTIGYWTTAQTFSGWNTASASDLNSFSGSLVTYLGASTGDLHLNMSLTATPLESNGATGLGITTDFDNQVRPGPIGSVNGGASLPDIGADEFDGVPATPKITFTSASPNFVPQCAASSRAIVVDVIPNSGTTSSVTLNYSHNGTAQAPISMTNTSGNSWTGTMVAPAIGNNTVTWNIVAANTGGFSTTYTGASYSDEPNTGLVATASASPSGLCAGSNTSLTIDFSGSGSAPTYTTPPAVSNPTTDEDFGNITISQGVTTILNNSSATNSLTGTLGVATGTVGSYSNFTSNGPFVLRHGQSYNFSVSSTTLNATFYANSMAIYIDYNRDGDFNDAGENVYVASATVSGPHTESGSFTIPSSASIGLTRMRVISNEGLITSPTMTVSYGEYEEYMLNLLPVATAHKWTDGTTVIGTSNPQITTVTATTTYTDTATVNGCPITASTTATISSTALSISGFTPTSSSICAGKLDTFNINYIDGCPPYNVYIKDPSGAKIDSVKNTSSLAHSRFLIPTTSGTYTLEVYDNNAALQTLTTSITINSAPVPTVSPTIASVCGSVSVPLVANATGTGLTYLWSVTGSPTVYTGLFTTAAATTAVTGATNNTATIYAKPTGNTSYTVTVTDGNGCFGTAAKQTNVYNALTSTISSTPTSLCAGGTADLLSTPAMSLGYSSASLTYAPVATPGTGVTTLCTGGAASVTLTLGTLDDGYWNAIATPFPIVLNGTSYSTVGIGTNGVIGFGSLTNQTGYANTLPSAAAANPSFAAFYVDLNNTAGSITYFTTGTAPNRKFVVKYSTVPYYTGAGIMNAQAEFNEDGTFESHVGTITTGTSTAGASVALIQSGTLATITRNNLPPSTFTAPEAWKFNKVTPNFTYSWDQSLGTSGATLSSTTINNPQAATFVATESYFVTVTETTSGCTKIDTTTISLALGGPNLTSITTSSSLPMCVGSSTTLTPVFTNGCGPFTYLWDDGNGNTYTTPTLTISPTTTTGYMLTITDFNSNTATTSSPFSVSINNPQPATTTGQTICSGAAAFSLNATATSGILKWYAAATGGSVLATGPSYITPSISTSTNYFVEESQLVGSSLVPIGNTTAPTTGTTGSPNGGMVFTTSTSNVLLNSIDIFVNGTDTMNFQLQDNTGAVIATSHQTVTGTTAALTNVVLPSTFLVVSPGTGYRILCVSKGTGITWYFQTGAYPYNSSPAGLNITGGYGWTAASTDLRCVHKINATLPSYCSGTRVSVAATLTSPPALALDSPNFAICNGTTSTTVDATAATVGNYTTYSWTPTTGVTSASTSATTFNPTTTTTYVLNASNASGCSKTVNLTVTVNQTPSALTLAQTSGGNLCLGSVDNLTATGGEILNQIVLNENFNAATNAWTTVNNSTSGAFAATEWTLRPNGYNYGGTTFNSNDATQFYHSNSDAQGSGAVTATELISPTFSTVGYTTLAVTYYHFFFYNAATAFANIEISTDGGSTWNIIKSHTSSQGGASAFSFDSINLAASYLNQSNCKLRFNYYDNSYGWYWAVDNVSIKGTYQPITWSPTASLYTNAGATTSYNGTDNLSSIFAKPSSNTTYTAIAANGTCTSTNTITSTIVPLPTLASSAQAAPVNAGTSATIDLTGLPNSASLTINYNIAGGANQTASVTSSATGTGSFATGSLITTNNGQTLTITSITNSTTGCTNTFTTGNSCTLVVNAVPTITLGTYPSVCFNSTTFKLPYTATTLTPNQYSIAVGTTNPMPSFTAVSGATLPSSPIVMTIPASTAAGTYDFVLTVTNTTTGLTSNPVPFNLVIYSASATVGLPSASATGATAQCIDGGDWIYYATGAAPNALLFAIKKGTSTLTGETIDVEYSATNNPSTIITSGSGHKHQSFLMGRGWDVTAPAFTGTVDVRFFCNLGTDTTSVHTDRDAAFTAASAGSGTTPSVKSNFEWFKTVGVPYTAAWRSGISGNSFPSTHIKLTPIYGNVVAGVDYVEFTGLTSFSGGSGGSGFGAPGAGGGSGLPVTWAGFDATATDAGNELVWKTSSEKNTDYFQVMYSLDASNYETIATKIKAAGTSATTLTYNFLHAKDYAKFTYYKIKQVDLDGKTDYSDPRLVKRTFEKPFMVNVYPMKNSTELFELSVSNIDKSMVKISIVDLTGKIVYKASVSPKTDILKQELNLITLNKGIYFVEVQNAQGKEVIKMMK